MYQVGDEQNEWVKFMKKKTLYSFLSGNRKKYDFPQSQICTNATSKLGGV